MPLDPKFDIFTPVFMRKEYQDEEDLIQGKISK